ncbi:MAG: hypothetical protein KatS3mg111_1339 [Pirellulaceae bacterium]|nr:MAG: hypothetical protein KatS3mg111_1339 [Pirellulaceae bacterium]
MLHRFPFLTTLVLLTVTLVASQEPVHGQQPLTDPDPYLSRPCDLTGEVPYVVLHGGTTLEQAVECLEAWCDNYCCEEEERAKNSGTGCQNQYCGDIEGPYWSSEPPIDGVEIICPNASTETPPQAVRRSSAGGRWYVEVRVRCRDGVCFTVRERGHTYQQAWAKAKSTARTVAPSLGCDCICSYCIRVLEKPCCPCPAPRCRLLRR